MLLPANEPPESLPAFSLSLRTALQKICSALFSISLPENVGACLRLPLLDPLKVLAAWWGACPALRNVLGRNLADCHTGPLWKDFAHARVCSGKPPSTRTLTGLVQASCSSRGCQKNANQARSKNKECQARAILKLYQRSDLGAPRSEGEEAHEHKAGLEGVTWLKGTWHG